MVMCRQVFLGADCPYPLIHSLLVSETQFTRASGVMGGRLGRPSNQINHVCLKRRTSTSAEALPSVLLGNLVLILCQFPPSPHRSVSCLTHITNFEIGPEVSISRSGWHSAIDGIRRVGAEIN
jgi:hypothetical protein